MTVFIRSDMPGLLARARVAEIRHRLGEIIALLSCEARNGRIALKLLQMAARADDRIDGGHRGVLVRLRGARRAGVRPGLGGEIFGERQRVLLDDDLGDRRHAIVLARALLEIAELEIEIARVLAPDDGRRRVFRQAFFAVARAAERRLFLDRIRPSGGRAGEERGHNSDYATCRGIPSLRQHRARSRAVIA